MNIIYFDYIKNFGINACVSGDWDFYSSLDDLHDDCVQVYGDDFVLASLNVSSSSFVGYKDSLNVLIY